jgi:hypothetical protein
MISYRWDDHYSPMLACRAVALAKAGAQIFFQTACRAEALRRRSKGAGKGGGGLPVREIGEVMFADGCRRSFAGGRVQTLPFFNVAFPST